MTINIRRKGLVRLWLIATLLFVGYATYHDANREQALWLENDSATQETCCWSANNIENSPPEANCYPAQPPFYERDGKTLFSWLFWEMGGYFVMDVFITLGLIAAFLVLRWVYRGFRPAT